MWIDIGTVTMNLSNTLYWSRGALNYRGSAATAPAETG
jgi:hypothetical protein